MDSDVKELVREPGVRLLEWWPVLTPSLSVLVEWSVVFMLMSERPSCKAAYKTDPP